MGVCGFAIDPSKELFQRWLTIGVYTPFFGHAEIDTRDKEPWSLGEQVESESRKLTELHYQLLHYLLSMFYKATHTGLPVSRSLAIINTYDANIYYSFNENEFMFGDALLVAPCKSTNQYTNVYFQGGSRYRLGSGKKYDGLQYAVVALRVYNLPVFVIRGFIIPM